MLGTPIITKSRNEIFKSLFKSRMIYGYGMIISFKAVMDFIFCRPVSKGFDQTVMETPDITGTLFLKERVLPLSALKWSFQRKTNSIWL